MNPPSSAPGPRPRIRLLDLGTLPVVCTVLTGLVALYMFLVALGNITDPDTNEAFVRHVLSMDTTFQDKDIMWRAITSKTVQDIGYVGIIVWESLTAAVLLWATAAWARALRTGLFDRPRRLSTVGLLMLEILFVGGFITIGGEWFAMWQSKTWNGLEPAFRNAMIGAFALVLIHLQAHEPSAAIGAEGGRTR
jgi:predicted small integral membrane protein